MSDAEAPILSGCPVGICGDCCELAGLAITSAARRKTGHDLFEHYFLPLLPRQALETLA